MSDSKSSQSFDASSASTAPTILGSKARAIQLQDIHSMSEQNDTAGRNDSVPNSRESNKLFEEEDITTLGFPHFAYVLTQSTDDLLGPSAHSDGASIYSSITNLDVGANTYPEQEANTKARDPIRLELSDLKGKSTRCSRVYRSSGTGTLIDWRSPSPPVESGECHIELDSLVFPASGIRFNSTEQLVPAPDDKQSRTRVSGKPCIRDAHQKRNALRNLSNQQPDHKSFPLQWPFQIFLLLIVAGILAFLEYQAHDLPPIHYQMFYVNPAGERRDVVTNFNRPQAETTHAISDLKLQASPAIKGFPPVTSTAHNAADSGTLIERAMHIAAPAPTPSPRPPKSEYPGPATLLTTHCGWDRPRYLVYMDEIDDKEIYNRPGETVLGLAQTISTFFTDDETWCPCYIMPRGSRKYEEIPWEFGWAPQEIPWNEYFIIDIRDKECRSVVSAVALHNYVAHRGSYRWVTSLADVIPLGRLSTTLTLTDPPTEITPQWPWPSTNPYGDILLPFRVSTVDYASLSSSSMLALDNFGNLLWYPPGTAFYQAFEFQEDPQTSTTWWALPPLSSRILPASTTSLDDVGDITSSNATPTNSEGRGATATTMTIGTSTTEQQVLQSESMETTSRRKTTVEEGQDSTASMRTGTDPTRSPDTHIVGITTTNLDRSPIAAVQSPKPTDSNVSGVLQTPSAATRVDGSAFLETTTILRSDGSYTTVITTHLASSTPKHPPPIGLEPTRIVQSTKSLNIFTPLASGAGSATTLIPGGISSQSPGVNSIKNTTASGITKPSILPGPIPPGAAAAFSNLDSEAGYLVASLIPILLTTLLAIVVQVFTSSVNSILPFRGLDHRGTTEDTIMLSRSPGPLAALTGIRFVRRYKDPLPLFNVLLGVLSTIVVPVSSEVIQLEFSTLCNNNPAGRSSAVVCAFGLRKSVVPIRVAEGILTAMAILTMGMGAVLLRWRTGVAAEPWSIASMSGLLSNHDFCRKIRSIPPCADGQYIQDARIEETLGRNTRFRIGFFQPQPPGERTKGNNNIASNQHYGINIILAVAEDDKVPIRLTSRHPPERKAMSSLKSSGWHTTPNTKRIILRVLALIMITGILILILYYENTTSPNTGFEAFMNSQTAGVRILFASFGTAISLFWDYYFSYESSQEIYRRLATPPPQAFPSSNPRTASSIQTNTANPGHPARTSILLSPPTNLFIAIHRSITPTLNLPSLFIATASLLGKFTPILLSNIPFRNTVTWKMHESCTWMAVATLSFMVLVLLASLIRELPITPQEKKAKGFYLPVGVDTIAGCMYYLCYSEEMLRNFEGLSLLGEKERDRLVHEMGGGYEFGEVTRVPLGNKGRLGVNYISSGGG